MHVSRTNELATLSERATAEAWSALRGDPRALGQLALQASERTLPSVYEVSAFATACVAVANLAIAEWLGPDEHVQLDARHASLAFQCERWLKPLGWELPPIWDALAGDYATRDGFIKLHTNYAYHRQAALRALSAAPTRDSLALALSTMTSDAAERDIVAAGGCAAALRSELEWARHPAGQAVAAEPLIAWRTAGCAPTQRSRAPSRGGRPLEGVRVLDVTRVIAGPLATRFLAAYGAEVLRVDPPGFQEVPLLLTEVTCGKRCAALDLRSERGRAQLEHLLTQADVLVCGLRSDALDRLGYTSEALRALNPSLIITRLNAYGWMGPFRTRRGFDSLVQMSCGTAERGMRAVRSDKPLPLPAQALDHGTGYLAAAAVVRALSVRRQTGECSEQWLSLARSALFMQSLGTASDIVGEALSEEARGSFMERDLTAYGAVERVRIPGALRSVQPYFAHPAGPLGVAEPSWLL